MGTCGNRLGDSGGTAGKNYTRNVELVLDTVRRHVAASDSFEETLASFDAELGDFAKLPLFGFSKRRTVEATYNALAANKR